MTISGIITRKRNLFFVLFTFLYSWIIYLIIFLFDWDTSHVESRLCLIAAFGPSLSAIYISSLINKRDPVVSEGRFIILSVLIFLISASVEWIDHIVWGHTITTQLIIVDIIIVGLATFVITRVWSDFVQIRSIFRRIYQFRVGKGWLLLSVLLWPSIVLFSNFIATLTGNPVSAAREYDLLKVVFLIAESFIWYLVFGAALAEEPGWRAFWLGNLQEKMSPLKASIIIGFFWGLWHLPLHLLGYYPYGALGAIIRVFEIPSAILFTWLFNRTKGSLVPVLFLHAARNTTSLFLPRNFIISSLVMTVIALVMVFIDRMWKKK